MEIQKIFSDMYDEERLYSVLMSEEELALFSEAKEKKENSTAKEMGKYALGTGAALGGVTAASLARSLVGDKTTHKAAEKVKRITRDQANFHESVNRIKRLAAREGYTTTPRYQEYLKDVVEPEVKRRDDVAKKALNKIQKIGKTKARKNALKAVGVATAVGAGLGAYDAYKRNKNKK